MTAPPPEGWSLAEAAAAWFGELWALAADTDICATPSARAAWIAKRRLDPDEPLGRLLAAPDLPADIIACLDRQRFEPGLIPRGIERARWSALCRADNELHRRWWAAVRRAEAARVALAKQFCAKMAEGGEAARGVVEGRPLDGEAVIPAAAWRAALPVFGYEAETVAGFPDVPGSVVLSGGVRVLGVRVLAAAPVTTGAAPAPTDRPRPAAPPPRPGIEVARAWMDAHVRPSGARWKREAAIAACRTATGCLRDDARAAWDELPMELRGRPGRQRCATDRNSAK